MVQLFMTKRCKILLQNHEGFLSQDPSILLQKAEGVTE